MKKIYDLRKKKKLRIHNKAIKKMDKMILKKKMVMTVKDSLTVLTTT